MITDEIKARTARIAHANLIIKALVHAQKALEELERVDDTLQDMYPLSNYQENSLLSRLTYNPLTSTRELVERLEGLS